MIVILLCVHPFSKLSLIISYTTFLWSFLTFRFKVCVWLGWAKQPRRKRQQCSRSQHTKHTTSVDGGQRDAWRLCVFHYYFTQTTRPDWKSGDPSTRFYVLCVVVLSNSSTVARVWNFYAGPNQWIVDRLCHLIVSVSAVANINALQDGMLRKGLNTYKPLTVRCCMLGLRHAAFETPSQFRIRPEADSIPLCLQFFQFLKVLFYHVYHYSLTPTEQHIVWWSVVCVCVIFVFL